MTEVVPWLALFVLLPLSLGAAISILDRSAIGPVRRAEAFLIPLFLIGVGGGGVSTFITTLFAARGEGLGAADPFRLPFGFVSLAIGVLGAVAAERRDRVREVTVVAATMLGIGSAAASLMFGAATDGLAPSIALQILCALVVPISLIWFLLALRRCERGELPTIVLRGWMIPLRRGSVAAVALAAPAFSVAVESGAVMGWSLLGFAAAAGAFWWIVQRSPSHGAGGAA